MSAPLPWQQSLWDDLISRLRSGTLPHALLFSGAVGYGKAVLAEALIQSLMCQSPEDDGRACGRCQGCGLLAAGTHPDLLEIEPKEKGKAIPVDSIRAVGDFLALKGQYSGRQVVLIKPAEAMNRFSANSLLKTLEEPSDDALLILISSQPSLLLPTIRSRCQQVTFQRPAVETSEPWLAAQLASREDGAPAIDLKALLMLSDGAPLGALALCESGGLAIRSELMEQWVGVRMGRGDPLACAKQWAELGIPQATQWLASWTMDLIRLKSGMDPDAISNGDLRPQLQKLVGGLELRALFAYLEQITDYTRWAGGQLNPQLAMEELMICWSRQR